MAKKKIAPPKASPEFDLNGQDDEVVELFQNSSGPSQFFSSHDAQKLPLASQTIAHASGPDVDVAPALAFNLQSPDTITTQTTLGLDDFSPRQLSSKKRKRSSEASHAEDRYLKRLARDEDRQVMSKLSVTDSREIDEHSRLFAYEGKTPSSLESGSGSKSDESKGIAKAKAGSRSQHVDAQKSSCTVFLANVSTSVIVSKHDRKTLLNHLVSMETGKKEHQPGYAINSIRFRSTPYSDAKIPRKAAFVKKALMDTTAKSTHAYAVYNSPIAAREAVRQLNGSILLDRHLRVDSVAHPLAQDHRRCIFVGNLGFVDDESAMQEAQVGFEQRRPTKAKASADYEEGLWRTFEACGKIENVRLVRAQTNQVGKGFAYVQFEDTNAVEKALLYNDKKFPPLLPRRLRVVRAKRMPSNKERPGLNHVSMEARKDGRHTAQTQTTLGRATKLYGRAVTAKLRRGRDGALEDRSSGVVFEGERATSRTQPMKGKKDVKRKKKKNGRPERAANFKRRQSEH